MIFPVRKLVTGNWIKYSKNCLEQLYSNKRLDSFLKVVHIPLNRAISSAGRASRLHRDGRQFESVIAHHRSIDSIE